MESSEKDSSIFIPGGYVLGPRQNPVEHASPAARETYEWLVKQANHMPAQVGGKAIMRGQCIRSYQDIQEGLSWYAGYAKKTYSKSQIEAAMKSLKKAGLLTTKKTTRGIVITIVHYCHYQNPANYESHTEATRKPQRDRSIYNNSKHKTEETNTGGCHLGAPQPPYLSNSDELRLAVHLFSKIKARNAEARAPDLQAWAKHIGYMIRLDHRDPEKIRAVIDWAQQDQFWSENILSTSKLREKYDQLLLKMNSGGNYGWKQSGERSTRADAETASKYAGLGEELS